MHTFIHALQYYVVYRTCACTNGIVHRILRHLHYVRMIFKVSAYIAFADLVILDYFVMDVFMFTVHIWDSDSYSALFTRL